MKKPTASKPLTIGFESFTIQQGSSSEFPLVHLPELTFKDRLNDEIVEREKKNYRVIVQQVAPGSGLPRFGLVRGKAVFLELERAQFVRLIQVLRTSGGIKLQLSLGERQDITSVDIIDPRVKQRAASDIQELQPSGTEC